MNKRVRLFTIFGLLTALATQSANAYADSEVTLDQLLTMSLEELMATKVTISTRTEQTLAKAPSVVSVITAEDIKATGATNLSEILQSVPGIYVRPNLFGFRPQITFRGASSTHTLLMVDGTPLKDLVWNAGIFWRGLPTSIIDRVEIIRGPGSALFGSDASAGAINVITKSAVGVKQSEVGVRAGGFGSRAGWIQHGDSWNGFAIDLTAEVARTDGHDPFIPKDGQSSRDASYGTDASQAPGDAAYGWDNQDIRLAISKDNWRLHLDSTRRTDVEIGLTGAGVLDGATQGNDSRFNLDLGYDDPKFTEHWGVSGTLSFQSLDYSSGEGFFERPPGYTDATGVYPDGQINRMRSAERGFGGDVGAVYKGLDGHALRIGAGYDVKDLYYVEQWVNYGIGPDGEMLPAGGPLVDLSDTPYAFVPEKTRRIGYLFLQDVWSISSDWELTAGVRYDHYSDFGGAVDPRVALVWQATEQLTAKLMYGEAFRAPSYLELYAPTSATKPNPDLTPERSRTWDLAFSYMVSKDLKLGIDLYRFEQSDLIGVDTANQFQNMGDNIARGVELEAMWQASRTVRLSGNLSVRDDDTPYNSVPEKSGYLRADWAFLPRWNWNVQASWIGSHSQSPTDSRDPIDAYAIVDSTLRYAPSSGWEAAFSLRNLFDEDARELSSRALKENLPLPGRTLYAELRYKF